MDNRKEHSAHSVLRRLLALSLSFCLLMGILPLNVFADGEGESAVQSEETIAETPTETPTDPPTEPPTDPETTAAPTEAPTEPETTAAPTESPTEPETTTAPTEAPTEPETTAAPTESPTEPETTEPTETSEMVVYTITFYNNRTNASDEPLELEAEPGDLLADLLGDEPWADGTLLVDCTWYAKEDTARETAIDLEQTIVEGDMELCTYDEEPRPMMAMRPLMLAAPLKATFTVTFHDIRSGTLVDTTEAVTATQDQLLSDVIAQQTMFDGPWYGEDGAVADATAQVTADLDLYTNDPTTRLTVTFHDQRTVSVNAYAGDTLRTLMGDKTWGEDWYSDAEMTTKVDLDTPIQENTDLYAGVEWDITVTSEGNRQNMIIPATVGDQRPPMETFEAYTGKIWYTVKEGVITVIDFNTLVTNGVPEEITAYTDVDPEYDGLVSVGQRPVKLYALQNRQAISLLDNPLNTYVDGDGQIWVPVAELEAALTQQYALWNVERTPIAAESLCLAYAQHDTEKLISYRTQVFRDQTLTDQVFTRLDNRTEAAQVYYFPNGSVSEPGTEFDLSEHAAENAVYSVTIEDPPRENQTTYYLGGETVTIRLDGDKTWIVKEDGISQETLAEGGDENTGEYSIENIQHSYVFSAQSDLRAVPMSSEDETIKTLKFYVSRDGSWTEIASRTDLTIYRDESVTEGTPIRKYLSAADLEVIYSDYHFNAATLVVGSSPDSLFAYTEGEIAADTDTTIYRDSPVRECGEETQKYVPITTTDSTDSTVSVLYIPRKTANDTANTLEIKDAQTFYTVTCHDARNDSEEGATTTVYALNGTSLAEAMADKVWGETSLSTLMWYTMDTAANVKTWIDPAATTVNGAMDVYAGGWAVTVVTREDGRLQMTIPVTPPDFRPTEADFECGEANYLQYVWYTESGPNKTKTVVDFQTYITNGVQAEVTAYTKRDLVYEGMTPKLDRTVHFFVFFNEQRVPVETRRDVTRYEKQNDRQYLTAALLADVYGKYGFTADMMTAGTKYFPHTDVNKPNIYIANGAIVQGKGYFSPVVNHNNSCEVYYLPNQTLTTNGPLENYKTDGFYTFAVTDPINKIYAAGEELPKVQVSADGTTASITVRNGDWRWQNKGVTLENAPPGKNNGDGTTTYTAPHNNMDYQYTLTTGFNEGEYVTTYQVNLPPNKLPQFPEYETPTIMGKQGSYTEAVTNSTHSVHALNRSTYNYKSDKYIGEAKFEHWKVFIGETDTGFEVLPGDELMTDALKGKLNDANTRYITLKAHWSTKIAEYSDTGKKSTMVNFFVGLNATPQDYTQWKVAGGDEKNFTKSVYTTDVGVSAPGSNTRILGGKQWDKVFNGKDNNGDDKLDSKDEIEMNLSEVHGLLVDKLSDGYDYGGKTYTIDFPTDEEVLLRIREYQGMSNWGHVRINGEDVDIDDLVAENFTIKWHTFFSSADDGWHVDGIIVAKTNYMTVTKTFTGDEDAIDVVKNNNKFSITVGLDGEDQFGAAHTGATLYLTEEEAEANGGIKPVSVSGNTYTWKVPVDQYYRYRLTENGEVYTLPEGAAHAEQITTTSRYNTRNCKKNDDTPGWQNYTESEGKGNVTVTAGNPGLSVAFQNSYTPVDVITLLKQDFETREPIEGVKFKLYSDAEGKIPIPLRALSGNRYYPADMEGTGDLKGGTPVDTITTDANGMAYLKMNHDPHQQKTFYLQEIPLDGYQELSMIQVEWGQEANTTDHILRASCEEDKDVTAENKMVTVDAPSLTLVVNNRSTAYANVRVVKNWLDNENTSVVLQLYRTEAKAPEAPDVHDAPDAHDASLVPVDDPVTLDTTVGWETTFEHLPLYVDGKAVEYVVRELAIGEFKFSNEFPTGFKYYHVSFDKPVYQNAAGTEVEPQEATQITLGVKNSRHIVGLHFRKVDPDHNGLTDAVFALYPAPTLNFGYPPPESPELNNPILQTECLADGTIVFRGQAAGKYYLKELTEPNGYERDDSLFGVDFDGTSVQVYKAVEGTWKRVDHNHIVNQPSEYVRVTIEKQVTGAMGDRTRPFDFTVTSDAEIKPGDGYGFDGNDRSKATFSLSDDQSVTLYVKKGSTLTIQETKVDGYTMSVDGEERNDFTHVCNVPNEANPGTYKVTVTNNKDGGTPDTGVVLDTLPYILLLVIAVGGALLLLRRRRRDE